MTTIDSMSREAVLDAFLAFLDERHGQLEETLARLDGLRAAVIRRDEQTLNALLEQARQDTCQQHDLAMRQRLLERRLAAVLDGVSLPITLSQVCAAVDGPRRAAFAEKRTILRQTAQRVQVEYEGTELLLRECARCNRDLLDAILGRSSRSLTYDAQGQSRQETHRGLVSVKL